MRLRGWGFRVVRVLRMVVVTAVVVVLVAFAFVQVQQRVLRHRAERLLADFQAIRLKQSNWADAQVLMERWGAWGHYEGTCTAEDCGYTVKLEDEVTKLYDAIGYGKYFWPIRAYGLLGGRFATVDMGFLVQDDLIRRSNFGIQLAVRPDKRKGDEYGYQLLFSTDADQSLKENHIDDGQLAQHPDYLAGRPGGCKICMFAMVSFTPHIQPDELRHITSYDFSCLTRLHDCRNLSDVLPVAKEWHLYDYHDGIPDPPERKGPPEPCDIPVYARGRDAEDVIVVEPVTISTGKDAPDLYSPSGQPWEREKVRVVEVLKGATIKAGPSLIDTAAFMGDFNFPWQAAEPLTKGTRYILMPSNFNATEPMFYMRRCGAFQDTPAIRAQLKEGFAQNDDLRRKDFSGWPPRRHP